MKTSDAIKHFGSAAALARAANISPAAVSQWGELIPFASAARLEKITRGKLKLRLEDYEERPPRAPARAKKNPAEAGSPVLHPESESGCGAITMLPVE